MIGDRGNDKPLIRHVLKMLNFTHIYYVSEELGTLNMLCSAMKNTYSSYITIIAMFRCHLAIHLAQLGQEPDGSMAQGHRLVEE